MQTEDLIDKTSKKKLSDLPSVHMCVDVFSRLWSTNYPQGKKQIPHIINPKHKAATTATTLCQKSVDPLIVQILAAKILLFIELWEKNPLWAPENNSALLIFHQSL